MSNINSQTDIEVPCMVFRVERREGSYLYADCTPGDQIAAESDGSQAVDASEQEQLQQLAVLEALPKELRATLGPLTPVMSLQLSPARKLAAADVLEVMRALRDQGYYLQMPPVVHEARAGDCAAPAKPDNGGSK